VKGLQFETRGQQFFGVQNEAFPAAMRVSNPDRSPVGINR